MKYTETIEKCCILLRWYIRASSSRITPPSVLFRPADFDLIVYFENAASCMNARRDASSRNLCLLACVIALWSARTYFAVLSTAGCALLCCVCRRCSTTTCSYTPWHSQKSPQKQTIGKTRLFLYKITNNYGKTLAGKVEKAWFKGEL